MRAGTLLFAAFGACVAFATAYAEIELPPGPNRALVYGQCRTCHDLQYLKESAGIPREAWSDLLDSMKQYGLRIPPDQRAKILDYLGTYLGPNPPPATAATAAASAPAKADGATVFRNQCEACHQANGQGVAGQFPPLAGNRDLFLSREFPAYVVLFGMEGDVKVEGKSFNSAMPPFDVLSDQEIAAVINYVRGAWGNDKLHSKRLPPLTAADVKAVRSKALTAKAVFDHRKRLK